jgi:ribulose-5-phosphate 4-epimerase/fuculose-1-phosphate aldolase
MLLATWKENGRDMTAAHMRVSPFSSRESIAALHAGIYVARPDAGGVAVSSPAGIRLLAQRGERMPPLFDEQVRHVGLRNVAVLDEANLSLEQIKKTFGRGANAALLGNRLVCIGITCERAVFNTELLEKCAQSYAIVKASGGRAAVIPAWVRVIANSRLKRDQRRAAESYRNGRIPDHVPGY